MTRTISSIGMLVIRTISLISILSALAYLPRAQEPTPPGDNDRRSRERTEIEKIVREYLLQNPSVIREALEALRANEENERRRIDAEKLVTKRTEIYGQSGSPSVVKSDDDLTIVVFFDYFCGYCKTALPALQDLLARDKSLGIVYKEFPILGPQSELAAKAALAAQRQGRYLEFHRKLLTANRVTTATIKKISGELGVSYIKLTADMRDPRLNDILGLNFQLAGYLDIDGTPAFIIGDRIIRGAVDISTLEAIISEERSRIVKPSMRQ